MIVEFWGTRSLIPLAASLPSTFGGNTSCVCLREADEILAIFDCGTGVIPLGRTANMSSAAQTHFFISKFSWDRIQGLLFLNPLFRSDFQAHFYGPKVEPHSLESLLTEQMRSEFFPVQFQDLPCQRYFHYYTWASEQPSRIQTAGLPDANITALKLHQHQPISAFRWNQQNISIAYAAHIDWNNPYPALEALADFLKDLQLLITNLPDTKLAWQNFWRYQRLAHPITTIFSDFSPFSSDADIIAALQQAQAQLGSFNSRGTISAAQARQKVQL